MRKRSRILVAICASLVLVQCRHNFACRLLAWDILSAPVPHRQARFPLLHRHALPVAPQVTGIAVPGFGWEIVLA